MTKIPLFLLFLGIQKSTSVTYNPTGHCYEDLLVAISPDVPSTDSGIIIANIKSWLTKGSEVLFRSTNGWAYIKSVKILLPANWDIVPDVTDAVDEVFEDAEVRVDLPSPIYGESPFTIQTGGCGAPGEYIQVSHQYFGEASGQAETYGPPGQAFVHEWAKFRYGVFEEHGYPGDPRYPMFYYKQRWTASGQTNVLTPNFCTNYDIAGYERDILRGGGCSYDTASGLPDDYCVYVVTGPDSINSSIMAVPYLPENTQFCDDNERFLHNPDIPTRHNDLCEGRSVFSVIKEHPDFGEYSDIYGEQDTTPSFRVIIPRKTEHLPYVMVLDASGSMNEQNRMVRLKQAATRFVTYSVQDGVPLGVVRFSIADEANTKVIYPITQLTDSIKLEVSNTINDMVVNGGTCLGDGIKKGLEALREYGEESGGVLIFLTDGEFSCDGPTISDVIDEVISQQVRVVTIAFGPKADFGLETLANRTNGQSFFVPDNGGPADLNTAFMGSLSFQPSLPSAYKEVTILEETFENQKEIQSNFTIGNFTGKDVSIQVDISTAGNIDVEFSMVPAPNGGEVSSKIQQSFFEQKFGKILPEEFQIALSSDAQLEFVTLKITSKAPDSVPPLTTECWSSARDSYLNLEGNEPDKLIIFSRVMQGSNPVIGATVRAYIDRDNGEYPIELQLSDDGQDPDMIKGDGLYSHYFTQFVAGSTGQKRYTLKCEAEGGETGMINQGFLQSTRTHFGHIRSLPADPTLETPVCCGSTTFREGSSTVPTGEFKRTKSGGLIGVGPTSGMSTNLYPPGRIGDLTVGNMDFAKNQFEISFTSTGDDLDQGTVTSQQIFFTSNYTLISGTSDLSLDTGLQEVTDDHLACDNCTFPSPQPSPNPVLLILDIGAGFTSSTGEEEQVFFRVQATDQGGRTSLSNIGRIYLTNKSIPVGKGLTWGIVFAVFIGSFLSTLLVVGAIFWHKKHYGW